MERSLEANLPYIVKVETGDSNYRCFIHKGHWYFETKYTPGLFYNTETRTFYSEKYARIFSDEEARAKGII